MKLSIAVVVTLAFVAALAVAQPLTDPQNVIINRPTGGQIGQLPGKNRPSPPAKKKPAPPVSTNTVVQEESVIKPDNQLSGPAIKPDNQLSGPAIKPDNQLSGPAIKPDNQPSGPAIETDSQPSRPSVKPDNQQSANVETLESWISSHGKPQQVPDMYNGKIVPTPKYPVRPFLM